MATSWLIGMLILDARLKKNALRKQLTLDAHSETPPDLTDRDAGLLVCLFIYNLLVCTTLCKGAKVCQDLKPRPALQSEDLWDYAEKTLEVKNVLFAYNIVTQWKYKVPVKSENWDYKLSEESHNLTEASQFSGYEPVKFRRRGL
ncbi:hypothetical protein ATANTOWER_008409 [Ataeniobius toweri]|uniref:Uncharacterized protein n=1 Tax=Ataeniobius toweri TaxID=208326 RepID=A0ABU7CAU0_9TELE|nr:hypothetical protein [Ataeniobius toweri]